MTTLGNYHHDFPRLAKETGYVFQLYRGKFSWSDIENLNLQDIIENRNFQLLEKNLINVINFDVDKEFDLKLSDKNFLKLFKLAQLGVDYLSFCELYLDRCVMLIEEQLIALQEECKLLRDERLTAPAKKKQKSLHYQCEKCKKFFISQVYLECHWKRRHNDENSSKMKSCNPVQEEPIVKPNQSSNILSCVYKKDVEDGAKEKMINEFVIDNLKRELEDLKIRVSKAEKKYSVEDNSSRTYLNGSLPCQGEEEQKPETEPETAELSVINVKKDREIFVEKKSPASEEVNILPVPKPLPRRHKKITNATKQSTSEHTTESRESLEPKDLNVINFQQVKIAESQTGRTEDFSRIEDIKNIEAHETKDVNQMDSESTLRLAFNETNLSNSKTNGVIQKIVTERPPRILELGKNFKKSLTSLYDSVSNPGKEINTRSSESGVNRTKINNNQVHSKPYQRFFMSKATIVQKVKEFKQDRMFLTKAKQPYTRENKLQESSLFKKLSQNFGDRKLIFRKSRGESEIEYEMDKNCLNNVKNSSANVIFKKTSMYNVDTDSDSDESISDEADIGHQEQGNDFGELEIVSDVDVTDKSKKETERETDFSIFQVGRGANIKNSTDSKQSLTRSTDELKPESNSGDDFRKGTTRPNLTEKTGILKIEEMAPMAVNSPVDNWRLCLESDESIADSE